MTSEDIVKSFIQFYKDRGHALVPNVSLVPEGDSTLLFVNSGMFPLVPYLSGEPHPLGKRLVNVQRAVRFEDLDDVGDATHTVAFHMLGNWSLGDYFKKEQLPWVYELLIEVLGLDPRRMYASVFEGDETVPKDDVSIAILKEIFAKYGIDAKEGTRIFAYGRGDNWWQRGDAVGELGGPDSEIFYYIGDGEPPEGVSPADSPGFIEIGNSVFMQYVRTEDGWKPLSQKNVDFGGGMERLALVSQSKKDIFETDSFWPIIERIQSLLNVNYYSDENTRKYLRVLADHMRSAVFLAMDGVMPSNKDQGYVLRRLLRRMVRTSRLLGGTSTLSRELVSVVVDMFKWLYPDLPAKEEYITDLFNDEVSRFVKTLESSHKEVDKLLRKNPSFTSVSLASIAFQVYQSYGYPLEMFLDDLQVRNIPFDSDSLTKEFNTLFEQHKSKSREGSLGKFKGGLADNSDEVVKYHTATHLIHEGLRKILGGTPFQVGSNITKDRLRFDFMWDKRLSDKELHDIEDFVNSAVDANLPVNFEMLDKSKALEIGAWFIPGESYPETVKVYYIGSSLNDALSMELCGGPHVSRTGLLDHIEIYKQKRLGAEKWRIYARFKKG